MRSSAVREALRHGAAVAGRAVSAGPAPWSAPVPPPSVPSSPVCGPEAPVPVPSFGGSVARDAEEASRGSRACTSKPPDRGPVRSVPPASRTRSSRPISPDPLPVAGVSGPCSGRSLRTETTVSSAVCVTWTVMGAPGACLAALVSASCTTR